MTKKQFALIVAVWAVVMTLLFVTPARSRDVGLVQTAGNPTCQEAKQDLLAVSIRLNHLKDLFQTEEDEHLSLVIKEEAKAVAQLGTKIIMFLKENCGGA